MAVRHAILPIGAVLVLGLAVYLFVQVHAQPPAYVAQASRPSHMVVAEPAPDTRASESVATSAPSTPTPPSPAVPPSAGRPAQHRPRISLPGRLDAVSQAVETGSASPEPDAAPGEPKIEAVMAEANKAYDRGDFEDAKQVASRVLATSPTNVRMLRIMVSASCMDGDGAAAQAHYAKLPPTDQEQMKVRCARYGITFAP